MNIHGIQLPLILSFLTAIVITMVHCLPMKEQVDETMWEQTGRIKANILGNLALMEQPPLDAPLMQDEENVVAAFEDYITAKEERRAHVKSSMPTITTAFVGELNKHGKSGFHLEKNVWGGSSAKCRAKCFEVN